MKLGRERVHHGGAGIAEPGTHVLAVHEAAWQGLRGEARRRVLARCGGYGAPLRLPLLPAAIEHRRTLESEGAQHPPDPGRPHDAAGRVEHDAGFVADAEPAHGVREPLGGGRHEAKARVGIGNRPLDVEEDGAGDMLRVVLGPTRDDAVGGVVPRLGRLEPRRAVHDAKPAHTEARLERAGLNERLRLTPV